MRVCIQVHYHIIPAPRPGAASSDAPAPESGEPGTRETRDRVTQPLTEKEMHWRELEARERLEEEDAKRLVESIRARL